MAVVRYRPDPKAPFKLSAEEEARLDAMTPEEIERNALEDPDNPPWTEDELARGAFSRSVRLARERMGLSQAQFAGRFGLRLAELKDWERGRFQPDSVAKAYLRVIEREPEAVERALRSEVAA